MLGLERGAAACSYGTARVNPKGVLGAEKGAGACSWDTARVNPKGKFGSERGAVACSYGTARVGRRWGGKTRLRREAFGQKSSKGWSVFRKRIAISTNVNSKRVYLGMPFSRISGGQSPCSSG